MIVLEESKWMPGRTGDSSADIHRRVFWKIPWKVSRNIFRSNFCTNRWENLWRNFWSIHQISLWINRCRKVLVISRQSLDEFQNKCLREFLNICGIIPERSFEENLTIIPELASFEEILNSLRNPWRNS